MIDKRQIRKSNYNYFELIRQIAIVEFRLKYQGSVFGYLWSLAKPLIYFAVLYLIFGVILKVSHGIPHFPIYLLLGVTIFSFWGEATSMAMNSIVAKGDLIRKIYFPRIILVISATMSTTITFLLNLLIVLVFAYYSGIQIGLNIFGLLLVFFQLYFLVLGVSFYLAALFVKFRDIGHIWEVGNQIIFYLTPILYPVALVPEKYAKYMMLSPLAQIIQDARYFLIGEKVLTVHSYWNFPYLPYIVTFFIFISGYLVFQKMAIQFAEEV